MALSMSSRIIKIHTRSTVDSRRDAVDGQRNVLVHLFSLSAACLVQCQRLENRPRSLADIFYF